MRSAAHAAHRAMHSHQHGRHAAPRLGELKRLASWATFTASRAVPSASVLGLGIGTVLGWGNLATIALAMRNFWPSQAAFRWELPATGALPAMTPVVPGTLAAAVLNPFDWCYGEVRVTLAVCLISAVASGTLLLRWSFDPASMRRSIAYAVGAGLGAAVPLLQFG